MARSWHYYCTVPGGEGVDAVKESAISLHDKASRTSLYKGLHKHLIIINEGYVFRTIKRLTCNSRTAS